MFGRSMGDWYAKRLASFDREETCQVMLRRSGLEFIGLRLLWSTWSQMCDFVDVGIGDGHPTGVFLDAKNMPTTATTGKLGMTIPLINHGAMLAAEGDWIIRAGNGVVFPVPDYRLAELFEVVELLHG